MRKFAFIRRFRRGFCLALLAGAALPLSTSPARAAPEVVVSILPLHSLVAQVMRGVGEPHLLMPAGQSPHGGQLKPSQVKQLNAADLIIWVGPSFEQAATKLIARNNRHARVVTLLEDDSMLRLPVREGGLWEAHDHAHGHGGHNDHDDAHDHDGHGDAHDDEHDGDDHAHDDHGERHDDAHHEHDAHDHDGHDDHDAHHGDHADWRIDPHIWLSVANARAIVDIAARELAAADPANAAQYDANRDAALARLAEFRRALSDQLRAVENAGYVVFHDAYHYFEHEFGVHPLGALTISPERRPGARRVREIRRAIRERGARCVFSEPQFQPDLAHTLAAGTGAAVAVLDPLGAALPPGPDAWFALMRGLADALTHCADGG